MNNMFDVLLEKINGVLSVSRTFIGVYVNKKGKFKVLKDPQTGKFSWFASCALIHNEFMNKLIANDPEFKDCRFYAISGVNYINHRLMLHGYENVDVKITRDMLLIFNAVSLEFHKKANLGLFMPVSEHLNKLNEKIQSDPSSLFMAAAKAKKLVMEESKPCCSCGTLCHVPELSQHEKIAVKHVKEIFELVEEGKLFCFACGIKFMVSTAKYKTMGWTDMAKAKAMNELINKCEQLDANQPNFDFDAAQKTVKEMMSYIASTTMTVLDGDEIKSEKTPKQNIIPKTSGQTPPPWMN